MAMRARHKQAMPDRQVHEIFDTVLQRRNMRRAVALEDFPDFLHRLVSDEICDRISMILRDFGTIVILADHPSGLESRLNETGKHDVIFVGDQIGCGSFTTDFECLPLADESVNCIISLLNLHGLNDVPGALMQYRRALKPDGLFVAALLGGGTFSELRQAWLMAEAEATDGVTPRVAPFGDVRSFGALMQRAGFTLPVVDCDRMSVTYDCALSAMREVKHMGWANVMHGRSRKPVTRSLLAKVAAMYEGACAGTDGRVPMSIEIVYLTGWAPHESQQQPLEPGSAKTRLADALSVREHRIANHPDDHK